jgi:hypothetical protein
MSNNTNNTSKSQNVNDKSQEWRNREVGAFWKKKNEKGSYCTGYVVVDELGQKIKKRVIMFANKNKSKENSPDFIVYLSNENEEQAKPVTATAAPVKKPAKLPVAVVDDDGIPDDLA